MLLLCELFRVSCCYYASRHWIIRLSAIQFSLASVNLSLLNYVFVWNQPYRPISCRACTIHLKKILDSVKCCFNLYRSVLIQINKYNAFTKEVCVKLYPVFQCLLWACEASKSKPSLFTQRKIQTKALCQKFIRRIVPPLKGLLQICSSKNTFWMEELI